MSGSCGKRTPRPLALAALTAAWRFVLRRERTRRWAVWFPLMLYWIQKRKRTENVQTGRVKTGARALWLPQFHLHFSAPASDPTRRGRLPGFHRATTIHESRRIVCGRQWVTARVVALAIPPRRRYRFSGVFHVDQSRLRLHDVVMRASTSSLRAPIGASMAAKLASRTPGPLIERAALDTLRSGSHGKSRVAFKVRNKSPIAASVAAKLVFRRRGSFIEQAAHDTLCSVQNGDPRATFETRRWRPRSERQVFRPRALTLGNSVPWRLDGAAVRKPQFGLAPELLWRQPRQAPSRIADEESRSDVPRFSQRTATGFLQEVPAPEVQPPIGRTAALEVTKLDPNLLERLTDDVIRRVEQRVRINRERRGL